MKYLDVKGVRFPAIGFGTSGLHGRSCTEMVRNALEMGYRHLDTARVYGNEEEVGRGMRESGLAREDIFLVTKVWRSNLRPRDVRRSAEDSLAALATPYVDCLLIHAPNDSVPLGETLGAFAELRAEGKIRYIGVSNFSVAQMREAVETCGVDVFCNQIEYNFATDRSDLLAYMRAQGSVLVAHRPLGRGSLVDHPVLARIGKVHGKTASQVALAWLVRQPGVAAIPRTSRMAHAHLNLDVFDVPFSDAELAEIGKLAQAA
jgi:2,5-diketo-D-gluconate reductase B